MRKIIAISLVTGLLATSGQARVVCAQFKTHQEAQQYFKANKPGAKRLDRDKDGLACECNKGGSREGEKVCKRWRKKKQP